MTRRWCLLHGLGATGAVWWSVARRLEALGHTVHAPDLPGHGTAESLPEYTVPALATAIAISPRPLAPHLVLIHSTLKLTDLLVSAAALEDSRRLGAKLEVVGEPRAIPFTADGYVDWEAVVPDEA